MKKLICGLLAMMMCSLLVACSSETKPGNTESTEEQISIVGQVASTVADDDSTLSVQVQDENGRWIIYHCDMKDEYLDEAKEFKMSDVAKVKGYLLSEMDLEQENTAVIVNLYDCELVE